MKILWLALTLLVMGGSACKKVDEFDELGDRVGSPIDVAVSDDGTRFYILNSDFDRTFDAGSILVINEEGTKLGHTQIPRLGRSMTLAGSDLLVLLDAETEEVEPQVRLFSLAENPDKPLLVKTWGPTEDMTCVPMNAAMVSGYDHFFITCTGGDLYFGTLKTPRHESTLKKVRRYGFTRRALYLDSQRELLMAFPTDIFGQKWKDREEEDKLTYDETTGKKSDGANEVPDILEADRFERRRRGQRRAYQFIVYDIAAERSPSDGKEPFPLRELNDDDDTTAEKEQRWLYFSLTDFDGTPDTDTGFTDLEKKYYRTNFWEAKPDPLDANGFFLSHRGRNTKHANNLVKVSMIGDLRAKDSDGNFLKTESVLSFERVYGFNGEITDDNKDKLYPGDFAVADVQGQKTLLLNHFRDLVNFRDNFHFGIVSKSLDQGFWLDEILTDDAGQSYFQVAMNSRGKAISCAFYGNAVIPLEVKPGAGITLGWSDLKRIQ